MEDQNTNEKQIDSINNNISEINESLNLIRNTFEKKYRDFDNCINNIMDNISEMSAKGINSEQNDKNLFKLSMNEIEREREKFNLFIEEHKLIQEKRDKENDTLKKIIDSMKIDLNHINDKLNKTKIMLKKII